MKAIEFLELIAAQQIPVKKTAGLCYMARNNDLSAEENVKIKMGIKAYAVSEYGSGNTMYPIRHSWLSPESAFILSTPEEMWDEGEYAKRRWHMIGWIVSYIESLEAEEAKNEPDYKF